ncbi:MULTISPECIES: NAD-dependent epimerase [Prochlorococcus]|uniref:NAD dependent epimerase/dehydratase n=1 Tax=Prochlorococcus marinus (strain SARG / CCMP1375 / SS120) TaxID=167539 RepID=Q7VAY8_PROMA|nr:MULTISPECIES: NAD-dependent epimerase [Prochlorococcus]AAQ00359.1 NAD dependent epimerase/dehydratase [Prochlorococcus marinus subsp. marinus str. CCMP1375]KGG14239.1 UDP-glucose 4-epimerase [Prochlorococcus marinus str. LG]KGG22189.1 UDP-glucose 4-epimerase [Prochlorococcus marinus str. SS2]KGG24494.1 UDP-glucose 4-epimerase [Prochlorococcus marinus str. SS35]KGG33389.1 UDP-glucose 4-epimerase [Prochlorococcus marinus str. SS51]
MRPVLITGAAGFIGAALVKKLLSEGERVIGIDNINEYYDTSLKYARLQYIESSSQEYLKNWVFHKLGIENIDEIKEIFTKESPRIVVNLAAQAGVRYSLDNPHAYVQSNLVGFCNLLEMCRHYEVENLIYASSSSVYGGNTNLPFNETQAVNHPVSFYAATKKSNELMAHTYSHLYDLPATGLRFFTVYGPWGRPDMAPMKFAKAILEGDPIQVFNFGRMKRDFTYIDDVVESIFRCCYLQATVNNNFDKSNPDPCTSFAPHRIFNVGNSQPTELDIFINLLEKSLSTKAIRDLLPMQPGDVVATAADTQKLKDWTGFSPSTSLEDGIQCFAEWYLSFYQS